MLGPLFVTTITLAVAIAGHLLWRWRVAEGTRRVARMNAGELCFHCEGDRVVRTPDGILCETCGQLTPRGLVEGGGALDPALIAKMTVDPRDRRPWYMR